VVESVGEHVEGFAAGDAVVPTLLGQCDRCPSCKSAHNNLCTSVPVTLAPGMRRDGTTRYRDVQGNPLHDLFAVSSFSEYAVVDVTQVVKVDPAVPPKIACLLGCGAGTGEPAWLVDQSEFTAGIHSPPIHQYTSTQFNQVWELRGGWPRWNLVRQLQSLDWDRSDWRYVRVSRLQLLCYHCHDRY